MKPSERLRKAIHLTAGILVVALALTADQLLGRPVDWSVFRWGLLLFGIAFAAAGRMRVPRLLSTLSLVGGIAWVLLCLVLLSLEGVFRLTGLGVKLDRQAWEAVPIYFRQPMTPYREGWFMRTGPATWKGSVLQQRVQQLGITPNPYTNEAPVAVSYDKDGFRNPSDLHDWEIAIAGDSFTELGYLPDEELFTSVLDNKSGLRVKNLGVSYTGTLSQLHYLQDFGRGKSTKHWIIVYFEGNDLEDTEAEVQAARFPHPERKFDGSFLRRLDSMARNVVWRWKGTHGAPNAVFTGNQSEPVTVMYAPPEAADLTEADQKNLRLSMKDFANFAEHAGITPWLVFVPCKRRVLHGRLEFQANCPPHIRDWKPTDLAGHIEQVCTGEGVRFIGTTDALRNETETSGISMFNSVFDSHLTAKGSRVVANSILSHFKSVLFE